MTDSDHVEETQPWKHVHCFLTDSGLHSMQGSSAEQLHSNKDDV